MLVTVASEYPAWVTSKQIAVEYMDDMGYKTVKNAQVSARYKLESLVEYGFVVKEVIYQAGGRKIFRYKYVWSEENNKIVRGLGGEAPIKERSFYQGCAA